MEAELANRAEKKGKTDEAEKWSKMDGKNKPTCQHASANEAAAEAAEQHRGAQALHQGVYPQGQGVKPDR